MKARTARKILFAGDRHYYARLVDPADTERFVVIPRSGRHNFLLMKACAKLRCPRLYEEMTAAIKAKLDEYGLV